MVNADRQAYVYNAVPATHRTSIDRPALNTIVSNIPIVEFMVPLCCGKCEEKVKEELENAEGVYKVVCDQHNQRVTVSSTLDPLRLLKRVKRVKKNSHFWSESTHLRNVHHVPSLPSDVHSHQSLVHRSDIPAYKPEPTHHRSTSRNSAQNQRYLSSRSSLDPVETQYLKRKYVAPQAEDPEFYYAGAEHQYKSSSHGSTPFRASLDVPEGYTTGTPYILAPMDSSLHYGHLPSSYGPTYEYSEDYALSSTGYY
jgi:copper chaperone CopZ